MATLTPDLLREADRLINEEGLSGRETAKRLGVSESGLRERRSKAVSGPPTPNPRVEVKGDTATVITPPSPNLGDVDQLLRDRGLSPEDWSVENVVVNEWDSPSGVMRQLKIHCKRKTPLEFVFPATDVRKRPQPKWRKGSRGKTWLLLSDHHAPYHDEGMHECVRMFLRDVKPDRAAHLGDGMDFPTISRHRDNPAWSATAQDCIQSFYEVLSDLRDASEGTEWFLLKGNHDVRLETELLARAERMFGIRPADVPGEPQDNALSIRRLLHLDSLAINLVEPPREGDNYEHAEIELAEDVYGMHGYLTGNNTAGKTIERIGGSAFFGHTHDQSVTQRTDYVKGVPKARVGVGIGCCCKIDGGMGYAKRPSWQNGGATVTTFMDGSFSFDLLRYEAGVLRWRDRQWAV